MAHVTTLAILLATAEADIPRDRVGAREAVGTELLRHEPSVRRLVHRLLGWSRRAGDLDDIVQDVLLAAWRNLDRFRGGAQPSTWLLRIAIHTTRSHQRRRALWRRLFPVGEAAAEPVAAAAPHPVDAQMTRVHAAMAQLAHADRELLVLRYLEQRDVEQIAADLDLPRNTVDVRLSRARARLRDLLPEALDA
jgi:RNA polymerase sigma-70 factor (ECF subfamily)